MAPDHRDFKSAINKRIVLEKLNVRTGVPSQSVTEKKHLNEDHNSNILETEEDRRRRHRSHLIVYINIFVMAMGFTVVMPGIWPYLQQVDPGSDKELLGLILAINPLGQCLTSPVLGLLSNYLMSSRATFLVTAVMFILGNVLYACLHAFGSKATTIMMFSRLLVGISSANISVARSYISSSTTLSERTTAIGLASSAQGLGYILGAGLQTAITLLFAAVNDEELDNYKSSSGVVRLADVIEWNMYTATAWFTVAIGVALFILFLPCVFQEFNITWTETTREGLEIDAAADTIPNPDYLALLGVTTAFFVSNLINVLFEMLLVPMCMDLYAMMAETAIIVSGIVLSIVGIVSVFMFIFAGYLTKMFDERKVLITLGIVPLTLGMLVHYPMGHHYPKIQNCTSVINRVSYNRLLTFDYTSKLLPISENQILAIYQSGYNLIPTFFMGVHHTQLTHLKSIQEDYSEQWQVPLGQGYKQSREGFCSPLGCPKEQEWCLYTPIVEPVQMVLADLLAALGYPIAVAVSVSLYSKIIGPSPQGFWMGILTSIGSVSRMSGSFLVFILYTEFGTRCIFGVLSFVMLFTLLFLLLIRNRLVPMEVCNQQQKSTRYGTT